MSNLVEHAKLELQRAGQTDEDPAFAQAIIAAVAAFASYGHSGSSAAVGTAMLAKLLRFEPLTMLTGDPDEWADHGVHDGVPVWQNKRWGAAFSNDRGKTYYLVDDTTRVLYQTDPATHTQLFP